MVISLATLEHKHAPNIIPLDALETKATEPKFGRAWVKNPLMGYATGLMHKMNTLFPTQYYTSRVPSILGGQGMGHAEAMREADLLSTPLDRGNVDIQGVPAKIGYGAGQMTPIVAGLTKPFMKGSQVALDKVANIPGLRRIPLWKTILGSGTAKSGLGFGAYELATHALTGGDPEQYADVTKSGILGGAAFHLGGRSGSTLFQPLAPYTKYAGKAGSGLGAALTGAAMAPEGEKIPSAMIAGAFGSMHEAKPFGMSLGQAKSKVVNIYKTALKPSAKLKNIILDTKNPDAIYLLAAQEELPVMRNKQTGKKDTTQAIEKLQPKRTEVYNQLNEALKSQPRTKFNIWEIARVAKNNARKLIKNSKELNETIEDINSYAEAEVLRRGSHIVNGVDLNIIKQGLWEQGYNQGRPTSKQSARILGNSAKTSIEKAFKQHDIMALNEKSGQYKILNDLLKYAHDKPVEQGKLGRYIATGTGAVVGGIAGHAAENLVPLPGLETVVGAKIGAEMGKRTSDYLSSPERTTSKAMKLSRKIQKIESRTYPLDRAVKDLGTKLNQIMSQPKIREYILSEAGELTPEMKAGAVEAEITSPKQLPAPQKIDPYRKLLPPKGQYGQSSGPVIKQGAAPELIPKPIEKLPYKPVPEKGAKIQGKGFEMTIGSQRKGQIGKKFSKLLKTTPENKIVDEIEKLPPTEKYVVKSMLKQLWHDYFGKRISNQKGALKLEKKKPVFESTGRPISSIGGGVGDIMTVNQKNPFMTKGLHKMSYVASENRMLMGGYGDMHADIIGKFGYNARNKWFKVPGGYPPRLPFFDSPEHVRTIIQPDPQNNQSVMGVRPFIPFGLGESTQKMSTKFDLNMTKMLKQAYDSTPKGTRLFLLPGIKHFDLMSGSERMTPETINAKAKNKELYRINKPFFEKFVIIDGMPVAFKN